MLCHRKCWRMAVLLLPFLLHALCIGPSDQDARQDNLKENGAGTCATAANSLYKDEPKDHSIVDFKQPGSPKKSALQLLADSQRRLIFDEHQVPFFTTFLPSNSRLSLEWSSDSTFSIPHAHFRESSRSIKAPFPSSDLSGSWSIPSSLYQDPAYQASGSGPQPISVVSSWASSPGIHHMGKAPTHTAESILSLPAPSPSITPESSVSIGPVFSRSRQMGPGSHPVSSMSFGSPSPFAHSNGFPSPPSVFHEVPPPHAGGGSPLALLVPPMISSPQVSHPTAEPPIVFSEPFFTFSVPAPSLTPEISASNISKPLSSFPLQLGPVSHPAPTTTPPQTRLPSWSSPSSPLSLAAPSSLPSFPRKSPHNDNILSSAAPTKEPMPPNQVLPPQTRRSFLTPGVHRLLPPIPAIGKTLIAPSSTDTTKHIRHPFLGSPMPLTKNSIRAKAPHSSLQALPPILTITSNIPSDSPTYHIQVSPRHHPILSPVPDVPGQIQPHFQPSQASHTTTSPTYLQPHLSPSHRGHHRKHLFTPAPTPFQGLAPKSAQGPPPDSPWHSRPPVHSPSDHVPAPLGAPSMKPKPTVPKPPITLPAPNTDHAPAPLGAPLIEPNPIVPKPPITSSPPNTGHDKAPLGAPQLVPKPAVPHPPMTLPSPSPSPSPSPDSGHAQAPLGVPRIEPKPAVPKPPVTLPSPNSGHTHAPTGAPQIEPMPAPPMTLPSPPPNRGCVRAPCSAPYTETPFGSPCGCVLPIQVELELAVALYALFPLISVLAEEIANGTLLIQSEVRIMGANADSLNQDKSIVDIDLVPLGEAFDSVTALIICQKFWNHALYINETLFGDYTVIFIRYPGLPPSPPLKHPGDSVPGEPSGINGGNTEQPLGVDIKRKSSKIGGGTIAVIALSSAIAVVIFLGIIWLMLLKCSHHTKYPLIVEPARTSSMTKRSGGGSLLSSDITSSTSMSFASSMATYAGSAKTFTFYELEKATDKFKLQNIVGEGGFGRVYRGILDDGTKVAVKVLTRDDQQGGREFIAEVEMLSRLHHRNLVKLIGICTEEHSRCLVYEFVPNGSLESHLHGIDKESAPLDWNARMKIALGAARGLAYLHEDSNPRVIHRDFKASNILLEDDFIPKVSDFGLAKTAPEEGSGHISTRVMGTFGYVAPEYAMTGHLLVKSDVYSYGVVLLELLSGRKPVDMSQPPGQENLVSWARPLLTSKEGLEVLVDPALGSTFPFDNMANVAAIASMCVQPEVSHRPFMGEVVQALKLVYNDTDASNGIGSVNGSQVGESPSHDSGARAGQPWHGTREQYAPDNTSFISIDYDSGPIHGVDMETDKPLSASIFLSASGRFVRQFSDSFRRHTTSGPLRTNEENSTWYRAREIDHGSTSDHALSRYLATGFDKDFYELWP